MVACGGLEGNGNAGWGKREVKQKKGLTLTNEMTLNRIVIDTEILFKRKKKLKQPNFQIV